MIGADFPVLEYEKIVADWRSLGLPDDVLEKVLYRNAEAYFQASR
jgi:predicted TIM-barrel fold metal-dependent hydrolase